MALDLLKIKSRFKELNDMAGDDGLNKINELPLKLIKEFEEYKKLYNDFADSTLINVEVKKIHEVVDILENMMLRATALEILFLHEKTDAEYSKAIMNLARDLGTHYIAARWLDICVSNVN